MCRYFYYVLGAVVVVSMIAYLIYQYRNSLKWRRYIDDWWLIVSLLSCEAIIFILCYYKFGMSADNDNLYYVIINLECLRTMITFGVLQER